MRDISTIKDEVYALLEARLADNLTYHSIDHTRDVVTQSLHIADVYRLCEEEKHLLTIAALFHDTGFIDAYGGHEEKSIQVFEEESKDYGLTDEQRELIHGMIRATKIPQTPNNFLEKIICDADLDYLGRQDFYTTGDLLYQEFKEYNIVRDKDEWNEVQVRFLESHSFHTGYSRLNRSFEKAKRLKELKKLIGQLPE